MVLRKPVAARVSAPQEHQSSNALPYPATPISPNRTGTATRPGIRDQPSASLENVEMDAQPQQSIPAMTNEWADVAIDRRKEDARIPVTLKVGGMGTAAENPWGDEGIPASLRPGPAETPRSSFESQRSTESAHKICDESAPTWNIPQSPPPVSHHSNNPYLRSTHQSYNVPEVARPQEVSSANIWGARSASPPPLNEAPLSSSRRKSQFDIPIAQTAALNISDESPYSGLSSQERWANSGLQPPQRPAPGVPAENPKNSQGTISARSSLISFESEEIQHPADINSSKESQPWPVPYSAESQQVKAPLPQPEVPFTYDERSSLPGLSLATNKHLPALPPSSELVDLSHTSLTTAEPVEAEEVPIHSASDLEAQQTKATTQRTETYQIKLINWYDASSHTNPRTSPILVQNANGPCPLLALVNALTLSTPAGVNTALVETLRVREQVSLGLLLDAVFDELTSGRRGDAAQELPDVGDLYAFLITLHTGMNVNPRFTSAQKEPPNLMDASVLNLADTVQESRQPGGFEETREMRLYSTFAIPLIHGWLPPRTHPAYAALGRSAKTYEDAQNLMFREEELEDKLQREGLSREEQLLLEDIASIKFFLSSTATQLTGYGLDTISEALSPGFIAILFRNDHFSTLYKHPTSHQLLTLVTDMGYAGHAEVVWESLVDVNGEGCEYFSGDFRPVGNVASSSQSQTSGTTSVDDRGWTTVSRSNNSNRSRQTHPLNTNIVNDQDQPLSQTLDLATSPNTEQEDHDLALAMQLQEEEEDRSRQQTLARQREDELSQAYLNSQQSSNRRGQGGRPSHRGRPGQFEPPTRARGSGRVIGQDIRPLVPPRGGSAPRDPERGDDAPPPSYEQAAKGTPYHPPPNHPAHSSAPPVSPAVETSPSMPPRPTMQGTRPRQLSAYTQNAAAYGGAPSTHGPPSSHGAGRRRSSVARSPVTPARASGYDGQPILPRRSALDSAEDEARPDKDCVVM